MQSAFVVTVVGSENSLLFDQWIITAPRDTPRGAHTWSTWRRDGLRQRWCAALRTTLAYAVAEPVWYWFMSTTSGNAAWWMLVAAYGSVGTVGVMMWIVSFGVKEMMCGCGRKGRCTLVGGAAAAAVTARPQYRDDEGGQAPAAKCIAEVAARDVIHTDDKREKMVLYPSQALPEGEQHRQHQQAPAIELTATEPPPNCTHKAPRKLLLAPLLPAVSAAATNAALVLYTRSLASEDTRAWLDRSAIGWTVIALLCALFFAVAKGVPLCIVGPVCNRRLALPADGGRREKVVEVVQRLACLMILILVRGMVRAVVGHEEAFVRVSVVEGSGWGLQILGTRESGHDGSESGHVLDRALAMIPWWYGWVWPLPLLIALPAVWEKWQRWRAERREHGRLQ
ncbi:hypothetical protein LTR85_004206 [Meristemomyces frigidus]|nr:hypothetical protein LTR85_004206 [Meristemomyces frigidus]